jgi:predicted unusual protein kinase regulating ubiquinone biosynthesis (AarF/ABC1/UbiB family)
VRDRVMSLLIGLVLRELFEFHLMQTDPNFANYRFNRATGQVVLLDFGATQSFAPSVAQAFRRLLDAGLDRDRSAAREAAMAVGLFDVRTPRSHQDAVMTMFDAAMEPLRMSGPFDFGSSDLAARLRDGGLAIGSQRESLHLPPADTLLIQRKIAGTYLLASRLRARVDVARLVAPWRHEPGR